MHRQEAAFFRRYEARYRGVSGSVPSESVPRGPANTPAYLFHLARNHPFLDGNKRTSLMCALVFLGLNGHRLEADPDAIYRLVDGVASGDVDKAEVAVFLRGHSAPR